MPPHPSIPGGDRYEDRLVRARIKHQWDPRALALDARVGGQCRCGECFCCAALEVLTEASRETIQSPPPERP